jgi:hypothetical protein
MNVPVMRFGKVIELGLGNKFAIGIFSFSMIEGLCSYE